MFLIDTKQGRIISDEEINKLHQKIALTRWPDEINDEYWSHGTGMSFLKNLSNEWLNSFNWRDHEEELNKIGSYKFKSNSGLKIHFLHSKSDKEGAVPLIMTHGWPGSIQEFLKIIPIIHKKSKIPIDIICPSMPGFGFSDKPTEKGMDSEKIARIQHDFRLQYDNIEIASVLSTYTYVYKVKGSDRQCMVVELRM